MSRATRDRLSLTDAARSLGVTPRALRRAIGDGRLKRAVGRQGGRPYVKDLELARVELQQHTRPRVTLNRTNGPASPSALALATQRERDARAALAELEFQRKSGELVPARDVEARWSAIVVAARTKLLGLPSRAKQRIPGLTPQDLNELDALVRQVLDELAEGK